MVRLAIFASGKGSNAAEIIAYFKNKGDVRIELIVCNNPKAEVLQLAAKNKIKSMLISKDEFYQTEKLLVDLEKLHIDFLVLAGFLWLLPEYLLKKFPNKIINIHPALLPQFGGKGMYGNKVHQAVIESGERESGISIHFVNEHYDEGKVIFQAKCPVDEDETVDSLKKKVQDLEHKYYPKVIEQVLTLPVGRS